MGGNSIAAIRAIAKLTKTFKIDVPIRLLFEHPTTLGMASSLEHELNYGSFDMLLPLRSTGELPPIFFVHPAAGLGWCYAGLLKYIPSKYPVYVLQSPNFTSSDNLSESNLCISDYLDEIKMVQPKGPYRLAGWSSGGLLAYSIACQIQKNRERVAFLSVFDAAPPNIDRNANPQNSHRLIDVANAIFRKDHGEELHSIASIYNDLMREQRLPPCFKESHFTALLKSYFDASIYSNAFVPEKYEGDLLAFVAISGQADSLNLTEQAWMPYLNGKLQIHPVLCTHNEMMDVGSLATLGPIFVQELARCS
jgi:nonribosomal peptide synthetase DhbF